MDMRAQLVERSTLVKIKTYFRTARSSFFGFFLLYSVKSTDLSLYLHTHYENLSIRGDLSRIAIRREIAIASGIHRRCHRDDQILDSKIMPMTDPVQSRQQLASAPMESDRSVSELRALDCNLTALCEHIQVEGFSGGSFSDVVVQSLGATFRLHRLVLSRSSYFRCIYLSLIEKE